MTQKTRDWFVADKEGLRKQLARRGKEHVLLELVSNAYDQNVTCVHIELIPASDSDVPRHFRCPPHVPRRGCYWLTVEDDDPLGFEDLAHAYTLFADTNKRRDPEKRGRFTVGEKHVLALCETATITSTKGGVRFDQDGRHRIRQKREHGSSFVGLIRMTKDEADRFVRLVRTVLPQVKTVFNGKLLSPPEPVHVFEAQLPTEYAGEDGQLRPTARKCEVRLYEPADGETATLYELGIPVVETGDRWHYDVRQRVPLNTDRDNVPPSFLKKLRALVLNEMHDRLDGDATVPWVREAASDSRCSDAAITTVLDRRFGPRRLAWDPTDVEASHKAVAHGYNVIAGGSLSAGEWENAKRAQAVERAGKVFPTQPETIAETKSIDDPTPGMQRIGELTRCLGKALLDMHVAVRFVSAPKASVLATWGTCMLTFNAGTLGEAWFEQEPTSEAVLDLLLHEFAHAYEPNHLSSGYHDALSLLGAKMTRLALSGRWPGGKS